MNKTNNTTYYAPTDDISFIPLTPEEEKSLFGRYYESNDLEARDKIIACHLKLVAKLSLRLARGLIADNDAISAGNFGLMQALEAKKFQPDRGVRFGSYLRLYLKGQIMLAIREKLEMLRGHSESNQACHCPDTTLTGHIGRRAPEALYKPGLSDAKVEPAALTIFMESLDDTHEGEFDGIEMVCDADRFAIIGDAISQLTPVEESAIRGTYFEDLSFAEIARRLGEITREGVRKAHDRAIDKLRKTLSFLGKEFGADVTKALVVDFSRPAAEELEEAA